MNYWITKLSSLNPIDEKKESLFVVNQMTATIARSIGFKEIDYVPFPNLKNNWNRRANLIEAMIAPIEEGDIVVIQLPLWIQFNFQSELIDALKQKKDVKLIGLLNKVVPYTNAESYDPETNFFIEQIQKFDLLITANEQMAKKLKQDNVKKPMISRINHDFLFKAPIQNDKFVKHLVYVAEEPIISLTNMPKLKTPLTIYGQEMPSHFDTSSITFCPDTTFEELPYLLNKGFGLVNIPELQSQSKNNFDNSLQYDNSLPLSIFLAAGLPLIVVSNTPQATWISNKRIGLVVSDWSEIDEALEKITATDYQIMLEAVKELQESVTTGVFTKRALLNAISVLELGYEDDIFNENGGINA